MHHRPLKILVALTLTALAVGVLLWILSNNQQATQTMTLKEYLLRSFVSELPEINKALPHAIDANTTLLSIVYEHGTVINQYQVHDLDLTQTQQQKLQRNLTPVVGQEICANPTKRQLIELDIPFLNRYQTRKGELVFEFLIRKEDCSEHI